ncbi:YciE/YciF ferroxidase family protein [Kaistella palustris]|uniref:YciE/YciF ferroxidase family protein n=1 Tax=Kaistella palustris TaxID=493376 RepID=UPI0003FCD161|nr:ferritin-like domain-containing protein [Kaistella palustris]
MEKPNESSMATSKKGDETKAATAADTTSKTENNPKSGADKSDKSTTEKSETEKNSGKAAAQSTADSKANGKAAGKTGSELDSNTDNSTEDEDDSEEKPLKKFFLDALKDIYFAEHAILEALPKMRDAATTEELKDAFEDHEIVTRKQIKRLEKVFRNIGEQAEKKKCEAIEGLIKETENIIKSTPEGTMTRDAALIIAAQKTEHYEIASYGGLVQLAITLGYDKCVDLLEDTLEEEENTDYDLTDIAESFINFEALNDDAEADYGEDDESEDYEDEAYEEEYDEEEYEESTSYH